MFHRLFYYRVLSQFRIGAVLFWNLLFPILLSTFLFLAMSGLMFPEKNDPVSIQVDNAQVAEVFAGIENRGVKLYRMEKTEDPKAALESCVSLPSVCLTCRRISARTKPLPWRALRGWSVSTARWV